MNGTLYAKIFDNGKIYIGITSNFGRRMVEHKYNAYTKNSQLPVHRAMRKYNHRTEIWAEGIDDWELLNQLEIQTIAQLKDIGVILYNISLGGDGVLGLKGELSYNYGKRLSDDTKQKIRLKALGRKLSDTSRSKISSKMIGWFDRLPKNKRVALIEIRKRNSTGRTHTNESKIKISLANIGKRLSDETKQKIRDSNIGKKHTQETKDKIRENSRKWRNENNDRYTKPKEYYSTKPTQRGSFKKICKNNKWDFNDFEEMFAEYKLRKDGVRKDKLYYYILKHKED